MQYRARHRSLTCSSPATKILPTKWGDRPTMSALPSVSSKRKRMAASTILLRVCCICAGTRPRSFRSAECFHTQFFTIKYGRLVESGSRRRISSSGCGTRPGRVRSSPRVQWQFPAYHWEREALQDCGPQQSDPSALGRGENEKDQ